MKNAKQQMHHFSVDDAIKYGLEKAVILANLKFWLNNNKTKDADSSKHDGYYWVYNTAKDISEVLPYFTQSKIQRLLKQLEDDGVLIVGNYNKVKYDRTKWYTLSEYSINDNCNTQSTDLDNGSIQSVQPIPDIKTNNKTVNKTDKLEKVILPVDKFEEMICTNEINIPFSDFWTKYDYNKGMKSSVEAKWGSLSDEERTLTMQSLDRYIQSTPDKTYRKFPMTYLNTESWKEEIIIPTDNTISVNRDSTITSSGNTFYSNTSYSASFKPFESNVGNRTRGDLECNLEALGITTEGTDTSNVNTDASSQIHWSELKAKGLLKTKINPTAIAPNTDTDKMINEFLARNSSNRFKDKMSA